MKKSWRERVLDPPDGKLWNFGAKAESWLTCAVGEQRMLHPEVVVYVRQPTWGKQRRLVPVDKMLMELGGEFYDCVLFGMQSEALDILDKIEDRVLELKREKVST